MAKKLSLQKGKNNSRRSIIILILLTLVTTCIGFSALWVSQSSGPENQPKKLAKADLSESKIGKKERSSHQVALGMPRALYINKIGVEEARILPMGLEKDGALAAPESIYDVGWYSESAKPGKGGALLMDGHVSGIGNTKGVFYNLKNLMVGDEIIIERGDHVKFFYEVKEKESLPIEKVDMEKAMRSIDPDVEGLNLITCGGDYDYGRQLYEDRVIIYATKK